MIARHRWLVLFLMVATGCAGEKPEGRPWVRDVRFVGVKSVKKKDLRSKLAVEETSWLHYPKKYLDAFTVDVDRQRIEAYYRAHGYFNARVTSAEVTPLKGKADAPTEVNVTFTVEEGAPTKVTSVSVQGLPAIKNAPKLDEQVKKTIVPGGIFVHQKYLDARDTLENQLKKLGYAWAQVKGVVDVNRDTRQAQVKLTVDTGPLARFGHVHIHGQQRTKEHEVALHAGIDYGARFDPDVLESARGKIYNLGVFSSVRVDYLHDERDPSIADVIVTVREGSFNELRLGGGIGFESLRNDVHLSGQYLRRNWMGGLRTLRLRLEPGYAAIPAVWNIQRSGPELTSDVQLTQPDWPCALCTLKATVGFDVGIDYAYQYYGPRTSLGLQRNFWHEHIQLGGSYNLQLLEFFNTDPTILNNPAQAGRLFGYTNPYRLGWFEQDLALDLRDKPLDAHQGVYVAFTAEEGGIYAGGAFDYEKLQPDLRGYVPLGSRVTFAARATFGQIYVQGDLGSPITRRFYLGGPDSHRGFNYERLSPQVPSGIAGVPPIPIGGDQMVLLSGELRVDVVQLFGQWLALAAFVDGGDVASPSCGSNTACQALMFRPSIDFADLYWATGGGIRYRTVIGTIRLDLGVRLNRLAPTEPDGTPNADPGQRFAFHISVGEAF